MTASTHGIELFKCAPLDARLTRKACAGNYKIAQHKALTTNLQELDMRAARAKCVGCEVGAAHARGETVPVERLVWKQVARAPEPKEPPVTEVPRVEGVLDERPNAKSAPTPKLITPKPKEQPMTGRVRTKEERAAIVSDALRKTMSIKEYAAKHDVSEQSLRNWLADAGHKSIGWPVKGAAPKLENPLEGIEIDPKTTLPPRAMDVTELASTRSTDPLTELMPVALVVPPRVSSILASLGVSAGVACVAQCLYMAGIAMGRDNQDLAVMWTDKAGHETTREIERTRGAA